MYRYIYLGGNAVGLIAKSSSSGKYIGYPMRFRRLIGYYFIYIVVINCEAPLVQQETPPLVKLETISLPDNDLNHMHAIILHRFAQVCITKCYNYACTDLDKL